MLKTLKGPPSPPHSAQSAVHSSTLRLLLQQRHPVATEQQCSSLRVGCELTAKNLFQICFSEFPDLKLNPDQFKMMDEFKLLFNPDFICDVMYRNSAMISQ